MIRKKILFVTNHFRFSNGVASVLRSMIDNLDQEKFDIHLLAIYEFNKEFAEPIKKKITVENGLNFYFRGLDKLINLLPLKWLYKFFVRGHYDLEVAFQFGIPTKMLSVSPNPNKICWMHTYDSKMVLRDYYKQFKEIITVAKIGREKLLKEGFSESQCDYCYNIIDEAVILNRIEDDVDVIKTHKYSLVTVSRLMPDKACMRQLECILELHKQGLDAEFWIIGTGSEYEQMRAFVESNQMQDYAKLLGLQKNPFKYVHRADLYFCGSFREGFSTACQEAALLGKPIISVDVDGAKELVMESGAGIVLDNSERGIIDGLSSILKDERLIERWKDLANKNAKLFYKGNRVKKIEEKLLRN